MIVIYPMIVSQAVSENAIPAIAKTAELYLVGNKIHDVINDVEVKKFNKIRNLTMKIVGKKIIAKEGVNLLEADDDDKDEYHGDWENKMKDRNTGTKKSPEEKKNDKEREDVIDFEKRMDRQRKREKEEEKREREKEKWKQDQEDRKDAEEKAKAAKASVNIKMTDFKTINLEPTFVPIEKTDKFGNLSRSMIGVKVLPLRVKSEAKLSALLMNDVKLNFINGIVIKFGRKFLRFVYKYINKWISKLFGGTYSGDPRRDVLMGDQNGKGFVVFSKTEDIDDLFLRNYSKINRLFKLGWGNIIIADEINRVAYFCMKDFKGVCNAISYAMMYQNLGQLKAYETLEAAERQSSSIFKIQKNFSKIIGESIVEQKLIKYNSTSEDK